MFRAAGSEALAIAIVTGIDECAEINRPLDQLQRIELVKMGIMAYETVLEGCANLEVSSQLEEAARRFTDKYRKVEP
jgi:hypothetical protein